MGWFLNLLDTSQMITLHVVVLPLTALGIVAIHLLWVRKRGIAPPFDALESHLTREEGAT
jgi:ubiquinol-cytochrome c reductase cytochrome b subunit